MSEHNLPPPPPPAGDPPPAPVPAADQASAAPADAGPAPEAATTADPAPAVAVAVPASPAPTPASFRQTSVLAIVSLVSGLLGLTLVPLLGSLVAIITGHMARAEIKRSPETTEGDGLAITGLVLGWGVILLSVLTVLFFVFMLGGLAVLLAAIGLGSQY